MRANCLPPPCPPPMTTIPNYAQPCVDEYGSAGVFGPMDSMPMGHPIATRCAPDRRVPSSGSVRSPVGFARIPPALLIPAACPPNECQPCPGVVPMPADDQGRPIPPGGRDRMPVLPPPTHLAPRPLPPPGGRGGGVRLPPIAMRPLPPNPNISVRPLPRNPNVGIGPMPGRRPTGQNPNISLRPLPRNPNVSVRPLPRNPNVAIGPVVPRFPATVSARGDLRTTINGFGGVSTRVEVTGGGIFDMPGRANGNVPFAPSMPTVMLPPGCPPPMRMAPCGTPSLPAPVVTIPGRQPCPAPIPRCANVPGADLVLPPPASGCGGFGWW